MKFLIMIIAFAVMDACNAQHSEEVVEIVYKTYSRGSSLEMKVSPNQLVYKTRESESSTPLTSEQWKSLTLLCDEIALDKIKDFPAPSNRRWGDMAAHANLIILTEKGNYRSQTFDAGNPPEELLLLIKELFEVAGIED